MAADDLDQAKLPMDGGNDDASAAAITFKVKSSGDHNHTITMPETSTVLDLKTKLAGEDYEKIPADRQRLIYSGRVMKNEEPLSTYKIKAGNTIHMVKSAASNAAQQPTATASATSNPAAGVPRNMAAGTEANNLLAGLTGARFAGHMGLPDAGVFGADGGMGAPPDEDAMAAMLDDPNTQQTINEALNNPAMIDMLINSNPLLRDNPQAREILASPEFRSVLTNPQMMRDAARMRRQMQNMGMGGMMGLGGAGGGSAFPAPGVTDTTPADAPGSTGVTGGGDGQGPSTQGSEAAANPFAALLNMGVGLGMEQPRSQGQTDASSGDGNSGAGAQPNASTNPDPAGSFASLFGPPGGAGVFGPNGPSPAAMQQALQFLNSGRGSGGESGGAAGMGGLGALGGLFGGGGMGRQGAGTPPAPADSRPPEERYAEQLRQLNDMGFFDFERNVEALRRSGGNVEGAVENLLR